MAANSEMKQLIADRQLTQWHLMIASLLGSLACQQGMFNQAFLNRLLKRSMDRFVVPYLETLPGYNEAVIAAEKGTTPAERLRPIVRFMDSVFAMAGVVELLEGDSERAILKIVSSGCRFCPVGVGKAELAPGDTFCPFPTMVESIANSMLSDGRIKTVLKRYGTKTMVLQKKDGECLITYGTMAEKRE